MLIGKFIIFKKLFNLLYSSLNNQSSLTYMFYYHSIKMCLSIATQPSLRTVVLHSSFVSSLSKLIRVFMGIYEQHGAAGVDPLMQETISLSLELIAQISLDSIEEGLSGVLLVEAIPAVNMLALHGDKDLRVLFVVTLRKLAPPLLRKYLLESNITETKVKSLLDIFNGLVHFLPALLKDEDPIPQYIIRTFAEIIGISDNFSQLLSVKFRVSGLTKLFVALLVNDNSMMTASPRSPSNFDLPDVQLIHLIRGLFDHSDSPLTIITYTSANSSHSPSKTTSTSTSTSTFKESTLIAGIIKLISSSVIKRDLELLVALLGLLSSILHYLIRLQTANENESSLSQTQNNLRRSPTDMNEIRQICTGLSSASFTLLYIISWHPKDFSNNNMESNMVEDRRTSFGDVQSSLLASIQETCSRCLGILFDLYPVTVVNQIIDGDTHLIKAYNCAHPTTSKILSHILIGNFVDINIRIRLLKLLLSIIKVSSSLTSRNSLKIKDFLSKSEIKEALETVSYISSSTSLKSSEQLSSYTDEDSSKTLNSLAFKILQGSKDIGN